MRRIGERYDLQHAIAATGNEGKLSPRVVDRRIRTCPDRNRRHLFSAIGLYEFRQTIAARRDQKLRVRRIGKAGGPLATRELVGSSDFARFGVDDRNFGGGFDVIEYPARTVGYRKFENVRRDGDRLDDFSRKRVN